MNRINEIMNNDKYKEYLIKITKHEEKRVFCKHNLMHFVDVCRIMYILGLEKNMKYTKDVIYACGLLHDIGRWQQYEDGIPHEIASANLAVDILRKSGYNEMEIEEIVEAIKGHRKDVHEENTLCKIMYMADKLSRECFRCPVEKACNWDSEKKNLIIRY